MSAGGQLKYAYTHNYVGNRMTMVVTNGSGAKTHVYQYDDIYQLTDVNYPTGYDYLATDTTFNYDAVGNRTTVIDGSGTTTYTANALNQYTAVADVNYTYDDSGNMTYDGANTYGYDPENRLVTATKCSGPLAAACDIEELTFTTGGDGQWFAQTTEYNYGDSAAQSGDIGDNEQTWLETTVDGPGTVYFDRKLSCDANDSLSFSIDGHNQIIWAGSKSWGTSGPWSVSGSGPHTLRWTYMKDSSGSGGSDCAWVDHVQWSGDLPDPNGWQEIAYTYDPAGRRIEKAVEGQAQVKYLYDGDHCIAEYDANDTLLRKYIHGPGVDHPVCDLMPPPPAWQPFVPHRSSGNASAARYNCRESNVYPVERKDARGGMQKLVTVLLGLLCGTVGGQPKELPARPPGAFFPLRAQDHREAGSFKRGAPVVGTTYFYWYDVESESHIVDGDGSDALTTHPADMEGISYKRAGWHEAQLRDMIAAGIDFLMPVYWGVPGSYDGWSFVGLPPLVEAHAALEKEGLEPPAIGMFYDTSILLWNNSNTNGGRYHVDVGTEFGKEWFYTAIRDFFSLIPPGKWARIDGRPIVFLYEAAFAKGQDPQGQFDYVKERFRKDFGAEPFIVKSPGWRGQADATYSWGGAVNGPLIFRETVALGPGYDHSAVAGRSPLIVERADGRTYIERWTKVLELDPKRRPWMVHVETWNEWHEGTDIAQSREYGRSYIVLTRLFADMWHGGTLLHLPGSYIDADRIHWEPRKPRGLELRPSGGDGNWELRALESTSAVFTTPNPHSQTGRYLYFNVDDAFAYGLLGGPVLLRVTYRDSGCSSFGVEYDSTVDEGPLDGAFRPTRAVALAGAGEWKTAQFRLSDCRFMNRCNGADLRLAIAGGDMELAVSRVELSKSDGSD